MRTEGLPWQGWRRAAAGEFLSRVLYYPYGETRSTEGTLPTDYQFTGQRAENFGLYDYHARFYDGAIGRFVSADTIVPQPGNPQDFNRYAYVRNSPLNYQDPGGHAPDKGFGNEWDEEWHYRAYFRGQGIMVGEVRGNRQVPGSTKVHMDSGFTIEELDALYQIYNMFPTTGLKHIIDANGFALDFDDPLGGYGSRFDNTYAPWIGIDTMGIRSEYAEDYHTNFVHIATHEFTHAWINTTPEGDAAHEAYERTFWTNAREEVMSRNPDEPTRYGQQHNPEEALAEVAGLAVSNPDGLRYTSGFGCWARDAGMPRRDFLARQMPFLRPLE